MNVFGHIDCCLVVRVCAYRRLAMSGRKNKKSTLEDPEMLRGRTRRGRVFRERNYATSIEDLKKIHGKAFSSEMHVSFRGKSNLRYIHSRWGKTFRLFIYRKTDRRS